MKPLLTHFRRMIYEIGRQLSAMLSLPEKQVLKGPILVAYLKPGIWTVSRDGYRSVDTQVA